MGVYTIMKVRIKNPDKPSMAKAIRAKCMNCAGEQEAEVRKCAIVDCHLFPYRFGCNPKSYINRNKDNVKIIS